MLRHFLGDFKNKDNLKKIVIYNSFSFSFIYINNNLLCFLFSTQNTVSWKWNIIFPHCCFTCFYFYTSFKFSIPGAKDGHHADYSKGGGNKTGEVWIANFDFWEWRVLSSTCLSRWEKDAVPSMRQDAKHRITFIVYYYGNIAYF